MSANLFDRFAAQPTVPRLPLDAGFAAHPRFVRLRDALARAAKSLGRLRWNEPPVFFFDRKRQTELEAARPAAPDRFADLTALIESEMPALAAVEVRRVARAVDGLASAAKALAPHCPAARELTELLAVPDDEVFLVLTPAARSGVRIHLRGAADVSQLRSLAASPTPSLNGREMLSTSPLEGEVASKASGWGVSASDSSQGSPPTRRVQSDAATSPSRGEVKPPLPQLFAPAALQPNGTLPAGFAGCEHWLWPTQPLAAVPRINGERIVLVGPTVVQAADAEPRFPTLAVEAEVIQTLNVFQTAEILSRLCGQPVPVQVPTGPPSVARAA